MKNEDRPAFPESVSHSPMGDLDHSYEAGLTKLEAFTKEIVAGLCANPNGNFSSYEELANEGLSIAKATLAALEKADE